MDLPIIRPKSPGEEMEEDLHLSDEPQQDLGETDDNFELISGQDEELHPEASSTATAAVEPPMAVEGGRSDSRKVSVRCDIPIANSNIRSSFKATDSSINRRSKIFGGQDRRTSEEASRASFKATDSSINRRSKIFGGQDRRTSEEASRASFFYKMGSISQDESNQIQDTVLARTYDG
jgi:hypothetical protein